ncbi:MAG TPA: sensor histidine kinase [Streptosporangiaceae bacterium]|nr:sensor histidine kinase [Streptosporangiaceae bacterium]
MGPADDWRGGWAGQWRRTVAAPHAPAVAGGLLGLIAVAESVAHAASAPQAAATGGVTLYALLLCLLGLATTVPLVFLRPAAAAVAISAACVLSLATFQILTVAGLGAELIAVYRLGRSGPQWKGAQLLAAGLAVPFLVLALTGPRPTGSEEGILTVLLASLVPAAAWAGIAQRARNEVLVYSAARENIAGTLLEHTARGERARIARELHDVVAHHISMIAVQAETARLTTPGMPAAGAQRLLEIGDTARAGLTEMRRLLGVLREDARAATAAQQAADGPAVDGSGADDRPGAGRAVADRHPQPGLPQLNELLDEARDVSGVGIRLIVSGPVAELDPGVELAAYRIVQEALTNSRRHAPGAAIDVELRYTDDALRLRIRDNGPGPPATPQPGGPAPVPGGHGLLGMRERAAAAGGRLRTGAAPGGGFLVDAMLPAKPEVAL